MGASLAPKHPRLQPPENGVEKSHNAGAMQVPFGKNFVLRIYGGEQVLESGDALRFAQDEKPRGFQGVVQNRDNFPL